MTEEIIIGTRGSDLALKQTDIAKQSLLSIKPTLQIQIKIIKTEGDINNAPISSSVVGKEWFTKEIENELLSGSVDIAVHSLKDMPEVLPEGLYIGAYLEREDARDVLIGKDNSTLETLPKSAVIGTDSVRRRMQILALRNDLVVKSIRGNVLTRLQKLDTDLYDALILAAAGLNRLGMTDRITRYFDIKEMMPAPGQGIIAVEARESDNELARLLVSINHPISRVQAQAERTFAKNVGGGCKHPTGAYSTLQNGKLLLHGMIISKDGRYLIRDSMSDLPEKATELGRKLAMIMLEKQNDLHA